MREIYVNAFTFRWNSYILSRCILNDRHKHTAQQTSRARVRPFSLSYLNIHINYECIKFHITFTCVPARWPGSDKYMGSVVHHSHTPHILAISLKMTLIRYHCVDHKSLSAVTFGPLTKTHFNRLIFHILFRFSNLSPMRSLIYYCLA